MKTAMSTINQSGRVEIANFLAHHHKKGTFTADHIRAWTEDAEFQIAEGNPPTIEIKSWDSVSGATVEFTVPDFGIDVQVIDVEE